MPEARTILAFTQRAAAATSRRCCASAVANAESNPTLHWNGDDLVVAAVFVDEGPTLKRWRARARGRVDRIRKRTCHITIKVAQDAPTRARAAAEPERAGAEAATPRAKPRPQEEGGSVMGQKVHPGGLRVGVIHDWKSNWMVGKKEFAGALLEDIKIREHILKKLSHAGLSDILIRKDKQRITIDIYTARPGIVIGKSGVEVDALRKEVHAMTQKNVHININEIKRPELDAKLVAQSIAEQLQNRVSFRRAMKRSLASAIRSGAAGVKVQCSGRLGGSEMSRSEQYSEGRVPLHTIRADIDYGFVEARTPTGRIGVKVWINKGEIMPQGYGGIPGGGKETRLGDQDTARRRGGVTEGLGASREAAAAAARIARASARCAAAVPASAAARAAPAAAARGDRPGAPRDAAAAASSRADAHAAASAPRRRREAPERAEPVDETAADAGRGPRRRRAEAEPTAADGRRRPKRSPQEEELTADAAAEEDQVPQDAPRPPARRGQGPDRRCSSATTGSRRSRPAGSPTARSRPPVSR